jgi:hypothetical protein
MKPGSTPVVVPYLIHKEQRRAVEIMPDTPQEMLKQIAAAHMGQPTKVLGVRYPIRDGDELTLIHETDAQTARQVKLQELQEADRFIAKQLGTSSSAPPTALEVQQQAPPRAQSRELLIPWEVSKPKTCEFNRQGSCVPVIFQLEGEQISEHTKRKAFISAIRDHSWEMEGERAFGLPIMISSEIRSATPNQVILCRTDFPPEVIKSTRGTLHVTPRVPLSFPVGITAVFNEEKAAIRIPNHTLVLHPGPIRSE